MVFSGARAQAPENLLEGDSTHRIREGLYAHSVRTVVLLFLSSTHPPTLSFYHPLTHPLSLSIIH
jgi:hypothetical protein